jgi:hypothetical protein
MGEREIRISMIFEGGKLPAVVCEPTDAEITSYAKTLKQLRPNQKLTLRRSRDGKSSVLLITTADEVIPVVQ